MEAIWQYWWGVCTEVTRSTGGYCDIAMLLLLMLLQMGITNDQADDTIQMTLMKIQ
jgi:hypothetical protein